MQFILGYLKNKFLTKQTYIQKLINYKNITGNETLNKTMEQTTCEHSILSCLLNNETPDFKQLADLYGNNTVSNALHNIELTVLFDYDLT